MDFSWNQEELELRDATVAFCRRRLGASDFSQRERRSEFSRSEWRLCGEQGLLGVTIPDEYGGMGQSPLVGTLVMEAFGYGSEDLGLAFSVAAHVFACAVPIVEFGTEEQKRCWLPRLTSGEVIAAHSITEPEAGSDIFAMKTRAERAGDHYVLNGTKCFATNAPAAGLFLIHAVTDPRKRFFGLDAFLVEASTPGLVIGEPYEKVGLRTSPIGDLYLNDCVVPASARLGGEGAGAPIFTVSMTWERTCLFAIYVGAMQRQLEAAIAHARERKQFGQAIGTFQAVAHRLVDMKVRLEAARLLLYKSAWNLTRGDDEPIDAFIAKLFVSEAAVQSALDAIQVFGGSGVVQGRIERYLRDAIPARVFSGTSEIQRNNIARALGLEG
ncbi:MAG: acyl-CoA dehydrogenase family protein [Kofleriaceae bacterium]